MGKIYLYARVSTVDQNPEAQSEALLKAYPDGMLFEEKASGTNANRQQLQEILRHIGEGDKLVVWKMDRFARSTKDALNLLEEIEAKGASFEILDSPINLSTIEGKLFIKLLSIVSDFEMDLRRERQMLGIAKAKEKGVYRKKNGEAHNKKHSDTVILEHVAAGKSVSQIAKLMGCSESTVARAKRKAKPKAIG